MTGGEEERIEVNCGGLGGGVKSSLFNFLLNAYCVFFFFNDTATTEIYTLSLHDALPIS